MSADISNLSNLQGGDPLDFDIYVDAKEAPPTPPKGRYIVRVSEKPTFGATNAGFLSAQIDPTILGPSNEGYQIRYVKLSAKPFKRGAATVSQLGDFLRAAGSQARPRTPQEQADAVEQLAGATLQVDVDWEAYDKDTKWSLKGMEKFPKLPSGGHDEWTEVPDPANPGKPMLDAEGNIRKIRARAKVDRFVAAV